MSLANSRDSLEFQSYVINNAVSLSIGRSAHLSVKATEVQRIISPTRINFSFVSVLLSFSQATKLNNLRASWLSSNYCCYYLIFFFFFLTIFPSLSSPILFSSPVIYSCSDH